MLSARAKTKKGKKQLGKVKKCKGWTKRAPTAWQKKLWPEAPEGEGTRDPWLFWASGALRFSSCNKYNIVYALVKSRLVTIVTD